MRLKLVTHLEKCLAQKRCVVRQFVFYQVTIQAAWHSELK